MRISETSSGRNSWRSYCFVFLLFFLVFGFFAYQTHQRSAYTQESWYWPSVKGVVISHATRKSHGGKSPAGHQQVVGYSYVVDEKSYSNDQVFWQQAMIYSDSAGAEQAMENDYPMGSQVLVYYDPASPSVAGLDRGKRGYPCRSHG